MNQLHSYPSIVPTDVLKECEQDIKEKLFKHFWSQVSRGITRTIPEWYKQELGRPRRRINVSEHNPNAWQDGFDAWQNGYDDAMYDGIDTSSEMPCKCDACLKAYGEGQEEAIKEIFGRGQSAQPLRAVDAAHACCKRCHELSGDNKCQWCRHKTPHQ